MINLVFILAWCLLGISCIVWVVSVRTRELSIFFNRSKTPDFEDAKNTDAENTCGNIKTLSSVLGNLSVGSLEDDKLTITVTGYKAISFSLNKAELYREKFARGNASELSYCAFELPRSCIQLFAKTGDQRLINLFWWALNEWESNWWYRCFGSLAWYDHCVANRLVVIRMAMLEFSKAGKLSPAEYKRLYTFCKAHAEFLHDDKTYDFNTNHGLIVDNYLLAFATTWPCSSLRQKWTLKSVKRSLGRVDHFISDDGVPLEGSCSYWYLIYKLLSKILENALSAEVEVPINAEKKLQMARTFLAETNINGKINRIGDTSGGHELAPPTAPLIKSDGYYLKLFDSGLIVLNGISKNRVVTQLMVNAQDTPPYVHRQQDTLSIGLYHDEVFWVNSPGSFSTGKSPKALAVRNWKNQSVPCDLLNGFSPRSKIKDIDFKKDTSFCITTEILHSNRPTIERRISFCLANEIITVEDSHLLEQGTVQTNWLLPPSTKIEQNDVNTLLLQNKAHSIRFKFSQQPTIGKGQISYARNKLEVTSVLATNTRSTVAEFNIPNGLEKLTYSKSDGSYPYVKRHAAKQNQLFKLGQRFHNKRIKMLIAAWAFILMSVNLLIFYYFGI